MSDESSPHGTPNPAPQPGGDGSWTPPPPSTTPPPPAPTEPSVDPSGGVNRAADHTGAVTAHGAGGATVTLTAGLVLGLVAVAAIATGLLIEESDIAGAPSVNLWDRTSAPLWSVVAIVAAVATLLPALRSSINVPARLAWTIAAVGAAYLVFWWVLFIIPSITLNVAFLVTLGVAAAVAAVWVSSDNPYRDEYTAS
jgi:hypothetical protein